MVFINEAGRLIIDCEEFDAPEYEGMVRGLITTIQTAVTSPHYQNTLSSEIDFAFMLLLKMLPGEHQVTTMFKKKTKIDASHLKN